MPLHHHNSYHPFILLAFYLDFLPQDIALQILKTTKHDWKERNNEKLFGHLWFKENKHLFNTLQQIAASKKL
jgi:putative transposase